jgi:integrase
VVDGVKVRKLVPLGTKDKAAARAKLRQLQAGQTTPATAAAAESLTDFAKRHFAAREALGLRSVRDERGYFERVWRDPLGSMSLAQITTHAIRDVLRDEADELSRSSLANARGVLRRIMADAVVEGVIAVNPAAGVSLRGIAKERDERPRTIPTDEEFRTLLACQKVGLEIKMLALLSRTVGGMRAGDLHSLDWQCFSAGFAICNVPRRKKRQPQPIEVPEPVRVLLAAWHVTQGSPTEGPVFPCRRGKRAGLLRVGKNSHADDLRTAFEAAGCTRHELLHDTPVSRRTDFHSLRRAYATGLARANVNAQTAQVLAGHSDPKTHMRYVVASVTAAPAAALPFLPAPPVANDVGYLEATGTDGGQIPQEFQAPPGRVELPANGLGSGRHCDPLHLSVDSDSDHCAAHVAADDAPGHHCLSWLPTAGGVCTGEASDSGSSLAYSRPRAPSYVVGLARLVEAVVSLPEAAARLPELRLTN